MIIGEFFMKLLISYHGNSSKRAYKNANHDIESIQWIISLQTYKITKEKINNAVKNIKMRIVQI